MFTAELTRTCLSPLLLLSTHLGGIAGGGHNRAELCPSANNRACPCLRRGRIEDGERAVGIHCVRSGVGSGCRPNVAIEGIVVTKCDIPPSVERADSYGSDRKLRGVVVLFGVEAAIGEDVIAYQGCVAAPALSVDNGQWGNAVLCCGAPNHQDHQCGHRQESDSGSFHRLLLILYSRFPGLREAVLSHPVPLSIRRNPRENGLKKKEEFG